MQPPLTKTLIAERLNAHTRDSYAFINSIIKGATVANAAYTLAMLLPSGVSPKLILWLASLFVLIVTDTAAQLDILLMNFRRSWLDSMLPLLVGLTEFLLFSVLLPEPTDKVWHYWYFAYAGFCLCASLVVFRITSQTRLSAYDADLQDTIRKYLAARKQDRIASGVSFIVWIFISAGMLHWVWRLRPADDWLFCSAGIVVFLHMSIVLAQKERQRHAVEEGVA